MAIAADSYSSVAEVTPFVRHLIVTGEEFDDLSRPSITEVESLIDQVSSLLNLALKGRGITTPVTTTDGALACDLWVRSKVAALMELTQRSEGFSGEDGSRYSAFWNLFEEAKEFVKDYLDGLKEDGVTVNEAASEGFVFTGLNIRSERADPTSTTVEQPLFRRRQFRP